MAADAEFVIDIAASMPDRQATSAELDALTRDLQKAGRGAEHFETATLQVSEALSAARAETQASKLALAEANSEFNLLERAVAKAQRVVSRAAAREGIVPIEDWENLQQAKRAAEEYAVTLRKLERRTEDAAESEAKFAKQARNVAALSRHIDDSLARSASELGVFRGALGDVGGPLGEFGERLLYPAQAFVDLRETMGSARATAVVTALGITAVAAAIAMLTAAAVAGVVAIASWGVKLASARKEAELTAQALDAIDPGLAAVRGSFAEITDATGQNEEALVSLRESLQSAQVSAEDMPRALRAAALAETALGKGGAAKFLADIKSGKLAVDEFADTVDEKFAGIVARRMQGLDKQSERLSENISDLFSGLEIAPIERAFAHLVELFDENTVAGGVLKDLFEGFFQPLINGAEAAFEMFEAFYLGIMIGAFEVFKVVKPVYKQLADLLGFDDDTSQESLDALVIAGRLVAYTFAAVGAALTVAAGVIAAMVAPIYGIKLAIENVFDFITETLPRWVSLGADFVAGIARGIARGAAKVYDAITGVMSDALDAAKAVWDIHSPSREAAGIVDDITDGYVQQAERNTYETDRAVANLLEPPDTNMKSAGAKVATASQAGMSSPSGSSRMSINLAGATFVFEGVADAEQAEGRFAELFTRLLEGDVASLGGATT